MNYTMNTTKAVKIAVASTGICLMIFWIIGLISFPRSMPLIAWSVCLAYAIITALWVSILRILEVKLPKMDVALWISLGLALLAMTIQYQFLPYLGYFYLYPVP